MKQIPPMAAVMTAFPYSIEADEPLSRARELMSQYGIRHLPVIEQGQLCGVIAEHDVDPAHGPPLRPDAVVPQVRDVVRGRPFVVELHEPLDAVALRMAEQRIDCVLVVKDGRLAGIFTVTDACRCLADLLRTLFPHPDGTDAA